MDLENSAFKENDGMNFQKTPIFAVNHEGTPNDKIDAEALATDIRSFWRSKQNTLWIIILCCSVYFLINLI